MTLLLMPSVKFFLRSNNDNQLTHVLYCRVSYNSTIAEISTSEKLDPKKWNQKTQKYKSESQSQTNHINFLVESLTYRVKAFFFDKNFRHSTAKEIVNEVFKPVEKPFSVIDLIEKYIISQSKLKFGTIKNHKVKKDNLKKFEQVIRLELTPENFDASIANKFISWFQKSKTTNNKTTAYRNISFFKSAMQWAINQGLISSFKLLNFCCEKDESKAAVFLTKTEFEKLINFKLDNFFLVKVRDAFVFQCCTGISYGDINSWLIDAKNDQTYLQGKRNKNGQEFRVPLNCIALSLLDKYDGKIPVLANAVYNRALKIIAEKLGIKKRLTTHVGRKTFATLQHDQGWSRESIALMLGHRSIRTTEHYYIGTSFERLENESKKFVR